MFKKLKKNALISTLIGFVALTAFTSVVFAASVTSPVTFYGPVNGYTYTNRATVETYTSVDDVLGGGDVTVQNASTVPIGYMGVMTQLYYEDTLCAQHNWYYNDDAAKGITVYAQDNCGAGYYTARGQTAAYNGDDYDYYNILGTPKLYGGSDDFSSTINQETTPKFTKEATSSFPKNKNGETYGSAKNVAYDSQPDLIQAIGVDGTHGYVRAKDLYTEKPKNPKEAMAKQINIAPGSVREIKLYDENGERVIGTFKISEGSENVRVKK